MIGLLGKKIGMTQIFSEEGQQIPVTVLQVGPCYVTALKTKDRDGYSAVQLGFGLAKDSRSNRPQKGRFQKAKCPSLKFVREIRTETIEGLELGAQISAGSFEEGDFVDVQGTSIGKGFQGVVKRHHFKGAQTSSHGTKHGREPGSIGQSSFPSRVIKGMRMAGHMGDELVTIQNLKVIKVDAVNNTLTVRGNVPGTENSYLVVRKALKKGPARPWQILNTPKEKSAQKLSPENTEKVSLDTEGNDSEKKS